MKIRFYKHKLRDTPHGRLVEIGHLPVRQTLIWLGPIFILIQR